MPTRAQVTALLEQGHSYETAARELHIPPGRAYMIATGVPADGGAAPSGGAQRLVNPPAFNPTRSAGVIDWVRERAARELTRRSR